MRADLRAVADACPQVLLGVNPRGRVRWANAAAVAWFKGDRRGPLVGADVAVLLAGVVRLPEAAALWPASGMTESAFDGEAQDGQQRRLAVRLRPARARSGRRSGWILCLGDRSEVQRGREQRDAALKLLNHDLRAPQSATLTLLELWRLRQGTLSEPEMLLQVETNARAALSTAEDFVRYMRLQDSEMRRESFDLRDVAAEAVDDLWGRARERRILIRRQQELPGAAPVEGDPELLQRAMHNMLRHALARSPGGATVDCNVFAMPQGFVFEVTDHGASLPGPGQGAITDTPGDGVALTPTEGDYALAFAVLVAARHGGVLRQRRAAAHGLTIGLCLPAAAPLSP